MPDNMATRKHSTLDDIVGANAPKESRAESVHDNHDRSIKALAEVTSDMTLGEKRYAVTSEPQSAAKKGEEQDEVRRTPCLVSLPLTDTAHRMMRRLLPRVPLYNRFCIPRSFWDRSSFTSLALTLLLLSMSTTLSTTALSVLPAYRRPCACAPALINHPKSTGYAEQGLSALRKK